jgi:hypothetical protein
VFITFPTIWLTFQETKQLSLEEIDLLWEGDRALSHLPAHLGNLGPEPDASEDKTVTTKIG